MANYVLDLPYEAAAAIVQYTAVKMTATSKVTPASGVNDFCVGVCQEDISAGDVTNGRIADVRVYGVTRMVAGAALATTGVRVRADASGRAVAVSGAAGTVDNVIGILQSVAGALGDVVDVLLTPGATVNTAVS